MKTGIIIPCYNEEERLRITTFINFINKENEFHLCFVNDGSTDNTIGVLHHMQAINPDKISVIDVKKNSGKAAAIKIGARYLQSRGDVDFVGYMNANIPDDFEDFDGHINTLQANQKLGMVFGNRGNNTSGYLKKDKFTALFSKIIKKSIYFIPKISIECTQSGTKTFTTELVPILY